MIETANGPQTIGALLRTGSAELRLAGAESPDLDARLLLAEVLGLQTSSLLARRESAVEERDAVKFTDWLDRRTGGEPVYRIIGKRGFYGRDFLLSPGTLEPRPDTEIVVEMAIAALKEIERDGPKRILDIGTGSGVIALSIIAECPDVTAIGTDISEDALRTATQNAVALGVADRFEARLGEYMAGVSGPIDLIVSNPPYIPTFEIASLSREVRDFDPIEALDGGDDGMRFYRRIATDARRHLPAGGTVLVEIGFEQNHRVVEIFQNAGLTSVTKGHDLAGVIRALQFR